MKDLLIVIDLQNDFITGPLGTPEARAIVPKVVEKIKEYRSAEQGVIYTLDTHSKEIYLNTQEGFNLPVLHCIVGTEGWKLIDDIEYRPSIFNSFEKDSFASIELAQIIQDINKEDHLPVESIEIIGVCTDICVISNALLIKAFNPGVKITVDASCCAGTTPENHKNALAAMKMCQIEIVGE